MHQNKKKQTGGCASVTHTKQNIMKNFINQFIPRDKEQLDALIGIFCGIAVLSIVFYFYSL